MPLFRARALLISVAAAMLAACGGSSSPAPSSPPPGSGDAIQITGRERFGWTQSADDVGQLHFAVYVDDNRVDLPAAVCHGSAPSFDCDSPLPPLGSGRHVLEVVAWTSSNGETAESPRAAPLIVQMTGSTASEAITSSMSSSVREQPSPPAKNTSTSCGLAPVSADRFILWSGSGEIRMVDRTSLASQALSVPQVPEGWSLIGLGAHSRFEENGWIYALQRNANGNELRLVRYRDVEGVLGEALVLREVPLSAGPVRSRISVRESDRIYVALLTAGGDPPVSTPSPFLIRLNSDGSIPAANPTGSIFMSVEGSPVAVDWASDDEVPWFIERDGTDEYVLRRRGAAVASKRFRGGAPPVAMQFADPGEANRLVVVQSDGAVTTFARTPAGWTLGKTRAAMQAESTGDALLFSDGDLVTCGPDRDAGYVVRRGSVPE